MARRRDGFAPFEIMGPRPAPPELAEATRPEPEPTASAREGGPAWWDAGAPVVLRLPRGFAVLLGVAILALVFLAYWVGSSRGAAAERAAFQEEQEQLRVGGRIPSGVGMVMQIPPAADRGDAEGPGAGSSRSGGGDPRRDGFNYLILARYPRADAERLATFLAGRGVETGIVSSDNAAFSQVVALRGFSSEQYGAGEHREYQDQLLRLGREWQAANGGRGDNLSSMYWHRYKAP